MRISETKLVQLVEKDPPVIVIVDESSGEEIALNNQETYNLIQACKYFIIGRDEFLP